MTVPAGPRGQYPEVMAHDVEPQETDTEFLGIPVTAAGKAKARRQLAAARARLTPERLNEMRALVGVAPVAE